MTIEEEINEIKSTENSVPTGGKPNDIKVPPTVKDYASKA